MDQPSPDEPIDPNDLVYIEDGPAGPTRPAGAAPGTTVSVHLTVQVGQHTKEFDVLATTDANGYIVARSLIGSLRDSASDWTHAHQ